MEQREYDLIMANYGVTRQRSYDIVLLPWGATEPHNLHLPYLTDCILSHDIAVDAARVAFERHGVRCMVMPPVTMGSQNPGQRDLPFCVHASYDTQRAILADTVASLRHQGFRKLVIVNGHGGNNFRNMMRDLSTAYPDFFIACGEWFKMAPVAEYFDQPGDHGFAVKALRQGKVWLPRHWNLASPDDTGIGNPALATAEKGRRFAEAVVAEYADFLRDFKQIQQAEDLYE